MPWSKWKAPLAILLVVAGLSGLAWGQLPATQHTAEFGNSDVYLTVTEAGKAPQRCRVLYCWQLGNGDTACQVQAVDTGELITLVNPPLPTSAPHLIQEGAPAQTNVSQIFRYGKNKTCPPGFPQPPAELAHNAVPQRTPLLVGLTKWAKGNPTHPTIITAPTTTHTPPPPTQVVKQTPAGSNKVLADLAQATPATPAPAKMIITQPAAAPKTLPAPQPLAQNPAKPASVNDSWTKLLETKNKAGADKAPLPPKFDVKPTMPVAKAPEPAKTDPLANPGQHIPDSAKKKLDLKPEPQAPFAPLANVGPTDKMPGYPGTGMQKPGIPLGAQSANAAYNGMNLPVKYLPTPLVTVPNPTTPPMPPPPSIPQPPNPVDYQNAFTPPAQPKGTTNGFPNPPMMTGNPYMYPPNPMMPPMPPYGMAPPMMYPPSVHMAQAQPQMPTSPSFPVNVPRTYQGPMPPSSPFGQPPVAQVAHQQPGYPVPHAGHPLHQGLYANPAMDRPGVPVAAPTTNAPSADTVYQMLTTLKTSLYPAQREWAAIHLSKCDWRSQPHLVQGLLTAAKDDPAAMVRIACIKTLVRIGVTRDVYAPTLQAMKADVDPRVRDAVEEALGTGTGTGLATQPPAALPAALPPVAPVSHSEQK